jgi:hypothetical protein
VLARSPAVVLTQSTEGQKHSSAVNALLYGTLRQYYRPIFTVPADAPPTVATIRVWQRRDIARPEQR